MTPPPGDNTQLQQVDMGHIKSWNEKDRDGFVCEQFDNQDCWDSDLLAVRSSIAEGEMSQESRVWTNPSK